MKKLYFLFVFLLVSAVSFGQDLIITAVYDAPLPGGLPKGVELYVINDIPDLSLYGIGSANNGGGTDGEEFTFPADAVTAGTFLYVASEDVQFPLWFGFAPDYNAGAAMGINGDDAIELFGNGSVIDTFGDINVDGNGTPWEYLDGWAYRVSGTGPDGGTFVLANWTFSGPNALDNETSNGTASTPIPIGTYSTMANNDPTITVGGDVTGLDYFFNNGPSAEDSFNVSGINLGANLVVTVPSPFAVSDTMGGPYGTSVSLTPDGGGTVSSTPIYVIMTAGQAVGDYSEDAFVSSTGATTQTVGLSGTVSPDDPQITISGGVGSLDYAFSSGGPSAEDSFNVSALFLQSNLTVTAPANFEVSDMAMGTYGPSVSFTPDGGGAVASTPVFIRLAGGLGIGNYNGDVTASATGASDQTLAVSGTVFGDNTNALVITGVYDGPLSGGTPKGVELYAIDDIPDLSVFGIGSANNGGGSDGEEFSFTGSASAGDFIYVASEATEFANFFGFAPDFNAGGAMGINGDDAIELFENGSVIDTFGDINVDGNGTPWEYLDGWAYRNDDSGPDGATFVLANWFFSGVDALEGETSNSTAAIPFPIGTYMTTLSVNSFNSESLKLYPNPVSNGQLNISTTTTETISVRVFDILGKEVISSNITNNSLDVSRLNTGLYIVKLSQGNATVTKKLIIK